MTLPPGETLPTTSNTNKGGGIKMKATHPSTADMVNLAIAELKKRNGCSLQAIKKHIGDRHEVNLDRLAPHIRRYVTEACESGALIRTRGRGLAGSFKLDEKVKKSIKEGRVEKRKPKASPPPKSKAIKGKPTEAKTKTTKKKSKKDDSAIVIEEPRSPTKKKAGVRKAMRKLLTPGKTLASKVRRLSKPKTPMSKVRRLSSKHLPKTPVSKVRRLSKTPVSKVRRLSKTNATKEVTKSKKKMVNKQLSSTNKASPKPKKKTKVDEKKSVKKKAEGK